MTAEAVRISRRPFPGAAGEFLAAFLRRDERLATLGPGLGAPAPSPPGAATSDGPLAGETADRIEKLNRAAGAAFPPERSEELRKPGTRFVLAGQQPGLALGPLFAFYKMATLRALAERDAARSGGAVLPVFWIASHDSDRAEIETVVLPGKQGEPETFRYPFPETHARSQVGSLAVEPREWAAFAERLSEALPPNEFREGAIEALRGSADGPTPLALLFARTARRLAASGEILFFDGRDAEIDPRGRALLAAAVREGPAVVRALRLGASLLEGAGWKPLLPADETRLPLFLLDGSVRVPLFLDGERAVPEGGAAVPLADLAKRIESGDVRATPSAALRPVVQDAVFPSLGLVAGHSELLYHAELGPLYELLGVRRAPLVPRASVFLLSRGAEIALAKMGIRPEEIAPGSAEPELVGDLEEPVRRYVDRVERETKALFEAIDLASPGAVPPEDPSRTRLPREAARLAERALRLADKAGENRRSKLHRIRGELFPRGKPQERVISFLHAVARFGPEAPEAIAGEIRAGEGWPEVFVVERGGAPA